MTSRPGKLGRDVRVIQRFHRFQRKRAGYWLPACGLQRLQIGLAAERHDRDLACPEIGKNHPRLALPPAPAARCSAVRRRAWAGRTPSRCRSSDRSAAPGPRPKGWSRRCAWCRPPHDRAAVRPGAARRWSRGCWVSMRARLAPHELPTHSTSRILVGAHAARSLRPRERAVEVGLVVGLVELRASGVARFISSFTGASLTSCDLPVASSPLPMMSSIISAHQPLPSRSPAAP